MLNSGLHGFKSTVQAGGMVIKWIVLSFGRVSIMAFKSHSQTYIADGPGAVASRLALPT